MPKKALFAEEKFYRKSKFWRTIIGLLFVIGFVLAFWGEIGSVLASIGELFKGIAPLQPANQFGRDLAVLLITIVMMVGMFGLALLGVSQFVLPVRTPQERMAVFSRLFMYWLGYHGPAIFIKEAKEKAREEELKSTKPGVAFVDLCSAVALEKSWVPHTNGGGSSGSVPLSGGSAGGESAGGGAPGGVEPPVRVSGPGIVFTESGERIRGVADLRRQLKITHNVSLSTRDGFEIRAPVWALFTLGEQAEVLKVAYIGGLKAENLQVVTVNPITNIVQASSDEIDGIDRAEIHAYAQAPWDAPLEQPVPGILPYLFFPGRVFAALYSQARNLADGNVVEWTELPSRVAIEAFRDMLAQEDYNNLYQPSSPDYYPYFDEYQPHFSRMMRNQGVLGFELITRNDGNPLTIGDVVTTPAMTIHPVTRLRSNKVLRERGIKVIAAGFPELTPLHQGVRGQLVEYWKANWQSAANLTEATAAAEAMQIYTQARTLAQTEMAGTLKKIIELEADSKAVIALRVMQALDTAAADPKTRALLSKDTISSIKNLRDILTG